MSVSTPTVHRFCDARLASDLELPELPPIAAPADISFHVAPVLPARRPTDGACQDWRAPDGGVSLSLCKSDGYDLVIPGIVRFAIGADGRDIAGCLEGRGQVDDMRHALVTQVLPRVLSLRGRLVLHASAVIGPHGAIAILGSGGAGKSTLAAAFLQAGHEVMTDDCLVLQPTEDADGCVAIAGPPGVRLHRDTAAQIFSPLAVRETAEDSGGKIRVGADAGAAGGPRDPARLVGAVLLEPSDVVRDGRAIEVDLLTPAEALMAFVEHSFQLELWDRAVLAARLQALAVVADLTPVVRLRFGHDLRAIPALRDRILNLSTRIVRPTSAPAPRHHHA